MRAAPAKRNKQPSIRSRGIHQPHGLGYRYVTAMTQTSPRNQGTEPTPSQNDPGHKTRTTTRRGVAEPSRADELLTQALKQALALVDVRTLDHFVVAGGQHHVLCRARPDLEQHERMPT